MIFSLIIFGVLLNAAAQLCLKAGMNRVGEFSFTIHNIIPIGFQTITNPFVFAGLCCYVLSVLIWLMVLSRVEVSFAYPMLSIGYIVNAIAAYYLFGEDLTLTRMIGIGIIIIGVYLIARPA